MNKLRPYQEEAVAQLFRLAADGVRSLLLVAPTGSGKTRMAQEVVTLYQQARPQAKILFVAHRVELVRQFKESSSSSSKTSSHSEALTVQSVSSPSAHSSADLLIIDEAHRRDSLDLIGSWTGQVLGLTATPFRMHLGRCVPLTEFQEMVIAATPSSLVTSGYLAPIKLLGPPLPPQAMGYLRKTKREGFEEIMEAMMGRADVIADVVETWVAAGPRPTILFAPMVKVAKEFASQFTARGFKAITLSGEASKNRRSAELEAFRNGEIDIICNADLLTEGVDVPRCSRIVMTRATTSPIVYLQQIGRGSRPFPGKDVCEIFDHVGNIVYHGHPYTDRVSGMDPNIPYLGMPTDREQLENIHRCDACYGYYFSEAKTCPLCGAEILKTKRNTTLRVNSAGKLVEYNEDQEALANAAAEKRDAEKHLNNTRIKYLFGHYARLGMKPMESRGLVMESFGIFKSDQRKPPDKRRWADWDAFVRTHLQAPRR